MLMKPCSKVPPFQGATRARWHHGCSYIGSSVSEHRDRLLLQSQSTADHHERLHTSAHNHELRQRLNGVRLSDRGSHDEGYARTAFAEPLNPYQSGSLERTQRPALGVGVDA